MKAPSKLRKNKKGAAAIEFALIAPLLFFLIFGILEFGITLAIDSTLSNALRSVARQSVVTPYSSATQVHQEMEYPMQNFHRDDTVVVMCAFPTINAIRAAGLHNDPRMLFETPPAYNPATGGCVTTTGGTITPQQQINNILIFGAEYNWGGISGLMTPIIPTKLYTVTILRSEYIE